MEGTPEGQEKGGAAAGNGKGEIVKAKVVEWEEFQDVLAQMCGRGLVLKKSLVDREALSQQLEAALEIRKVSLERVDALEAMHRQVHAKNLRLKSAQEALRNLRGELAKKTGFLEPSTRTLHIAFRAVADAQRRLQVAKSLLAGDGGLERLRKLCYSLDSRRRRMLAQLAFVYPLASLKPENSTSQGVERETANKDGSSLIIAGMPLSEPGKKLTGHAKDKSESDMSATALGYVGHMVTLVAQYLDVQLRYPIRQMASRSFIQDYCPAIEPAVDAVTAAVAPQYGSQRTVEFPLFSEGQDTTRSAYAVFLLNKDLEQILNHLGLESVGPRHTLLNLEKLLKGLETTDIS